MENDNFFKKDKIFFLFMCFLLYNLMVNFLFTEIGFHYIL